MLAYTVCTKIGERADTMDSNVLLSGLAVVLVLFKLVDPLVYSLLGAKRSRR